MTEQQPLRPRVCHGRARAARAGRCWACTWAGSGRSLRSTCTACWARGGVRRATRPARCATTRPCSPARARRAPGRPPTCASSSMRWPPPPRRRCAARAKRVALLAVTQCSLCHAYSRRPQRKRGEPPVLDPAPGVYAACLAVKYGILVCYLCITAALSLDAQLTGPAAASTNPFTRARHLQGEPPELDLPLPEVDAARVAATCDDQVCYADAAARALPDEAWRRLEAPLLPGAPQAGACQQNRCAKLSVLGRLGAGRAPLLDGGCVQPDWRSAS